MRPRAPRLVRFECRFREWRRLFHFDDDFFDDCICATEVAEIPFDTFPDVNRELFGVGHHIDPPPALLDVDAHGIKADAGLRLFEMQRVNQPVRRSRRCCDEGRRLGPRRRGNE